IPIYEWSVEKAVCSSRGLYLPSINQLDVLNITNGNIYANHKWPATQPFLTHEEGKRVSLINGGVSVGAQGYLTCVDTEELETINVSIVTDFSSELSIGDIRRMEVKLSYSDGSDGLAKPEEVYFTSNDEAIVQVDESGIVTAVATGSAMVRATRRGSSLFDEVQVDVKDPSGLFPLDLTVPINTGTAILVMYVDEANNSTTFSPNAEPIITSGEGEVLGEAGDWYFTSDTEGVTELIVSHNGILETMRIETIDTAAQFSYRMLTQRINTTGVPGNSSFVGFHHPSLTIASSGTITHLGASDPVGEGYIGSIADDIDGGIRLYVHPYGEPLSEAPDGTIKVHSFNGPGFLIHDGRSMYCNSNEVGTLLINWVFLKAWHDIPAGTIIPVSIMCR
ncbi:Ig-like domain-containing protein, partial [Photobacterium sanctipauli]